MGPGSEGMLCGESPSALEGGLRWRPTQHPHPPHQDTWSQIRAVKALLLEFCEKFPWHPGSYFDIKSLLCNVARVRGRTDTMTQKGSFMIQIDQRLCIFPNPLGEVSGVLHYILRLRFN
jgi:hypothetical protein